MMKSNLLLEVNIMRKFYHTDLGTVDVPEFLLGVYKEQISEDKWDRRRILA